MLMFHVTSKARFHLSTVKTGLTRVLVFPTEHRICKYATESRLRHSICAEESMDDLNARMEVPMSIIRFRPNIVLRGGKAFEEDNWAEITIGDAGKFWLLTRSPRYSPSASRR